MNKCECCDHPLQHAISRALNVAPYLGAHQALAELRHDLQEWEDDN
jgi:hypothetical protein